MLQMLTIYFTTRKLRRGFAVVEGAATASVGAGAFQAAAATTERARRRRRQEHLVTAMLVSISTTFVVCHCTEPFIHANVYAAFGGPCSIYEPEYNVRRVVVNILEMFSYAINFVFFCIFERQFRAALRALFDRPINGLSSLLCTCNRPNQCCVNKTSNATETTVGGNGGEETFTVVAYNTGIY